MGGGFKMSSKPSKWLLSIKGGRHERKLGYFLSLGFLIIIIIIIIINRLV